MIFSKININEILTEYNEMIQNSCPYNYASINGKQVFIIAQKINENLTMPIIRADDDNEYLTILNDNLYLVSSTNEINKKKTGQNHIIEKVLEIVKNVDKIEPVQLLETKAVKGVSKALITKRERTKDYNKVEEEVATFEEAIELLAEQWGIKAGSAKNWIIKNIKKSKLFEVEEQIIEKAPKTTAGKALKKKKKK